MRMTEFNAESPAEEEKAGVYQIASKPVAPHEPGADRFAAEHRQRDWTSEKPFPRAIPRPRAAQRTLYGDDHHDGR